MFLILQNKTGSESPLVQCLLKTKSVLFLDQLQLPWAKSLSQMYFRESGDRPSITYSGTLGTGWDPQGCQLQQYPPPLWGFSAYSFTKFTVGSLRSTTSHSQSRWKWVQGCQHYDEHFQLPISPDKVGLFTLEAKRKCGLPVKDQDSPTQFLLQVFSSLPRNEVTLFWVSSLLHCFRYHVIKDKTCTNLRGLGQKCTATVFIVFSFLATQHSMQNFPNQGCNSCPLQWKHAVLTTEPPEKSWVYS